MAKFYLTIKLHFTINDPLPVLPGNEQDLGHENLVNTLGLGYPQLGQGYTPLPETEQQSEYLLRGGRYASCVHAGGLSSYVSFLPPAYVVRREGNSFTLSVHTWGGVRSGGGGGQVQLEGGSQVQLAGGCQVQPGGQVQLMGGGGQVQPVGGGGVQVQLVGGVRSSQQGGVRSSRWGGVSILRPLAGGMPLAFTQEDFLVLVIFTLSIIIIDTSV